MTALHIILGVVIIAVPALMLYWLGRRSPALIHKNRLDKLVRSIGSAPEFVATMASQGRISQKTVRQNAEVEVVRRIGLSQSGYLHRCEYCDSPLYINQKNCSGCGAPRG